ncbi:uncharacterized protein MONBRDRAFT_7561 [Monosiga brevicollis MX1]|uniref:Transforming acidic coiled-coil-containing protein C-terminal domain-containing protein n=1 Tax=Monosiga brevicollis TaxID=81824 RepID=A9UXD3_MONBE|nr:uncharacterized protein MONBRDRAFT_7561 [Monosiga brevicollis MX1]EDQ90369.1 predicted protein [Monosiga brevicollis MX1]|eukprot:XP_001745136.1 hypothetical protein [Monosiga brevicollis MX1]
MGRANRMDTTTSSFVDSDFQTPSKVFGSSGTGTGAGYNGRSQAADLDLDALRLSGGNSGTASDLARQSLYRRFDPAFASPANTPEPATSKTNSAAAVGAPPPGKLLDMATPEAVRHHRQLPSGPGTNSATPTNPSVPDFLSTTLKTHSAAPTTPSIAEATPSNIMAAVIPSGEFAGRSVEELIEELRVAQELEAELENKETELRYAQADLHKADESYRALHDRFLRTRTNIEHLQENERKLKQTVTELQKVNEQLRKEHQAMADKIATQINSVNQHISEMESKHSSELAAAETKVRMAQTRLEQTQRELENKTQDNKELQEICDSLLARIEQ